VIRGRSVKMSKSKKNVIDPAELVDSYGADTVRMFCLFASPPERDLEWSDQGVEGAYRFLNRVWRLVSENLEELNKVSGYSGNSLEGGLKTLNRKVHETIKKVTADIEDRFHFNTAISAVMELINDVYRYLNDNEDKDSEAWSVIKGAIESAILLLSPVVPHITEELWNMLGNGDSLFDAGWPSYSEDALEVDRKLLVIQVNGKVRSRIEIPVSFSREEIEKEAVDDERIRNFIGDKKIKKIIVVKQKLVNIVV
jgi:leucyl-tRNA synthetase